MKIAILGSRGIPNIYGGFEQYAEFLSLGLAKRGLDVSVYCSSTHPDERTKYGGVSRIICHDPEYRMGTTGQFFYDLNCILDARKRDFDIIYQLGYTSNSIWWWLLPKKPVIVTNMDGLEWKRSKYSAKVRAFLKYAEKLAVGHSDHLIADSIGIQSYLRDKYQVDSKYFPYGADVFEEPKKEAIEKYSVEPGKYAMLIARMEPENNIEMIIKGHLRSEISMPLLVVGNTTNEFGEYLKSTYESNLIVFTQGIYDQDVLNNLRYFCGVYFHGHSVGGTNPSLLEALGSARLIAANDNIFNKAIVGQHGLYFSSVDDVAEIIRDYYHGKYQEDYRTVNFEKVRKTYQWDKIIEDHLIYFQTLIEE